MKIKIDKEELEAIRTRSKAELKAIRAFLNESRLETESSPVNIFMKFQYALLKTYEWWTEE